MADPSLRSLETPRLTLTPVDGSDVEDLYEIWRDPAIGAPMSEEPPASVEVMRARVASWLEGSPPDSAERWLNWLARTHDGATVGHVSATVEGPSAWIAWVVAVAQQRRGYATEAARAVADALAADGITTLLASIPEGHLASEGVATKLGLLLTEERAHGERVWRTELSGS